MKRDMKHRSVFFQVCGRFFRCTPKRERIIDVFTRSYFGNFNWFNRNYVKIVDASNSRFEEGIWRSTWKKTRYES